MQQGMLYDLKGKVTISDRRNNVHWADFHIEANKAFPKVTESLKTGNDLFHYYHSTVNNNSWT